MSSIGKEIAQTRPFRSQGHEAVISLWRTADMIRRHLERIIEEQGITGQQFNVLRILRGAGSQGLPTLTIAERMIEQAPGVTRLVDRLALQGLVERERSTEDRRLVVVTITPKGGQLLKALDGPVAKAEEQIAGCLRPVELERMMQTLDTMRAAMRGDSPDARR